MSTAYSIGQMNQLADALETAGYSSQDITALRSKISLLKNLRFVLVGHADVVIKPINLDAGPFVPIGYKVVEHIQGGQFKWDPTKVALYVSESQQEVGGIPGGQLRKELRGQSVYNANLLDYLLVHPELIPEKWKFKIVVFWGTIYRTLHGDLCVRFLYWDHGVAAAWRWDSRWLDNTFADNLHTAIRAAT